MWYAIIFLISVDISFDSEMKRKKKLFILRREKKKRKL